MTGRPGMDRNQAFDQTFFDDGPSSWATVAFVALVLFVVGLLLPVLAIVLLCVLGSVFVYLWRCYRERRWWRAHDTGFNIERDDGDAGF